MIALTAAGSAIPGLTGSETQGRLLPGAGKSPNRQPLLTCVRPTVFHHRPASRQSGRPENRSEPRQRVFDRCLLSLLVAVHRPFRSVHLRSPEPRLERGRRPAHASCPRVRQRQHVRGKGHRRALRRETEDWAISCAFVAGGTSRFRGGPRVLCPDPVRPTRLPAGRFSTRHGERWAEAG